MRVMVLIKANADSEAGVRWRGKAGVLLDAVGLTQSSKGVRVKFAAGKPVVTDGPFIETKELIAGFTMIKAKPLDEAIAWVKRWPKEDDDPEIEIRQLFEPENFA